MSESRVNPNRESRIGVAYGLAAYLWWGFAALYFKAVAHVSASEVLAQRVFWSALLLTTLVIYRGRLRQLIAALRRPSSLLTLLASTALVATNWFTFIWAVDHERVLEASLGYFINPLVNVLLGFLVLGERLRRLQWFSVALAATGVTILTVNYGRLPVIALVLAFSFGLYGLLRKRLEDVDALLGLTAETWILTPLALSYLVVLDREGSLVFGHLDRRTDVLLGLSGVVTALPLLWFHNAARRLRYATVGFLQYIAPSFQFLLAVVVFHEPLTSNDMLCFALIWGALALYSMDAVRASRPLSSSSGASGDAQSS